MFVNHFYSLFSYSPVSRYFGCFQHFVLQAMLQRIILCMCVFLMLYMYLKGKFLEVGFWGQRINAYRVLLDITKLPSQKVSLIVTIVWLSYQHICFLSNLTQ